MTKNEFIFLLAIGLIIGAWLAHVISCLVHATWGFLIAGALLFQIGIIHGGGIWLGVW